mgnify:CR=1 FL=1
MAGREAAIDEIMRRVEKLRPSHRDPEAFHVEKSEIVAALRGLAGPSRPREPRAESARQFFRRARILA